MFTAIVTSHQNDGGLRSMLGNLMYQTRPPDATLVIVSRPYEFQALVEDFPHAKFIQDQDRKDWGHFKRHMGIEIVKPEGYLGFFNDDDSYAINYLEQMVGLAEDEDADVVYCNWSGVQDCDFRLGSSTSGNFIVRAELAKKVGWRYRDYEADGKFINDLVRKGARKIVKHPSILYYHNIQPPRS